MSIDNYFHIYNRGAHKVPIFNTNADYERFIKLLYIANSTKNIQLSNCRRGNIFSIDRGEKLISIKAYCLMPNHFHIVARSTVAKGLTKFMRKICTGYSMYYNIKYKHSGTIIQGKYKSKEIIDEEYMRTIIKYVHLNPYGINNPNLTSDARKELEKEAEKTSREYLYSSFKDYLGEIRPQRPTLDL